MVAEIGQNCWSGFPPISWGTCARKSIIPTYTSSTHKASGWFKPLRTRATSAPFFGFLGAFPALVMVEIGVGSWIRFPP